MIKVLFVCHGNICRSPMAEAVFAHLVREAGLADQFEIDSAGTSGYHEGEEAHPGTLRVLSEHGINYDGHSRPLTRRDLGHYDYIIAMDEENLHGIRALGQSKGKVALLLDYAPQTEEREVPDPYYHGAFNRVYHLILAGDEGLLAQIRKDHKLP
jgi:protein-tyrosine phosphatase